MTSGSQELSTGDLLVLPVPDNVNRKIRGLCLIPSINSMRIGQNFLSQRSFGSQGYSVLGRYDGWRVLYCGQAGSRLRRLFRKSIDLWIVSNQAEAGCLRRRGGLGFLNEELPDKMLTRINAVESKLRRADDVVLGIGVQFLLPRCSGDRVNRSHSDFDDRRFPGRAGETYPQCFSRPRADKDGNLHIPCAWHAMSVVLGAMNGESPKAARRNMGAVRVR